MSMRKLIESIDAIENEMTAEALIGRGSDMSRYTHPDIENSKNTDDKESNEFDTFKGVTVANGESFLTDMATAFGGLKGQKLNIEVTLKGANMLAYRISRVKNDSQSGESGALPGDSENISNLISQGR